MKIVVTFNNRKTGILNGDKPTDFCDVRANLQFLQPEEFELVELGEIMWMLSGATKYEIPLKYVFIYNGYTSIDKLRKLFYEHVINQNYIIEFVK